MAAKKETGDFSFRPFSNLKESIESEMLKRTAVDRRQEHTPCADDEELFRIEMKDVREIADFRRIKIPRRRHITLPARSDADREAIKLLEEISKGKRPIRLTDTQEYIEWVNPDCANAAIAMILHEGRFAVQDFIDLHGLTADEAEAHVAGFIRGSRMKGLRCVKIIHGRGLRSPEGPVLKNALFGWLSGRFRKNVIAFATARQCDGGLGAMYILLSLRPVKKKISSVNR